MATWPKARVLEASDRSYLNIVLPLLEAAKKEIALSLYLLEPSDTQGLQHPVNQLVEALLGARGRGLKIRMLLNSNFRFRPKSEVGQGKYFERLLEAGVELVTLLPNRRLHDKCIVIDGRYVIEGSMNWSVAALMTNYESATVIDSRPHAAKKLERIGLIMNPPPPRPKIRKARPDTVRPLAKVPESVEIPDALIKNGPLSKMIATSDRRSFDLYLVLLGQARAQAKDEIFIDLETVAHALGLPKGWDRTKIRRQMIKVLKKLDKKYGVLTAEFPFGKDVKIILKPMEGETFWMPGGGLEAEYLSKASSAGAFFEMADYLLKKEGSSIDSLSSLEIEQRFGAGARSIRRARQALSSPA